MRFLGNPWPHPSVAPTPWSDSVLQALYDAVHAVALTIAGATSLMYEAKVDVVTVPNLSEHLSSAETTSHLSARFGTAAAMTSVNNLLLLVDGETWNRQRIDFSRPAGHGQNLPAGRGPRRRHSGHASAGPVAGGTVGHSHGVGWNRRERADICGRAALAARRRNR